MLKGKISPLYLNIALVAIILSYYWLPWVNVQTLDLLKWTKSSEEKEFPGWAENIHALDSDIQQTQMYQNLLRENSRLTEELMRQGIEWKGANQDLRFLKSEVIGPFYRKNREVWMLDMGSDYNIKRGNFIFQKGQLVGRVLELAQTCCLAEPLTAPGYKIFVRIEGMKGEYLWEGMGNNLAKIKLKQIKKTKWKGKFVYLSVSSSLGGDLRLGQIQRIDRKLQQGWFQLYIEGRRVEQGDILYIVQDKEKKDIRLFEMRDELTRLKRRVAELELNKLRLELLKK